MLAMFRDKSAVITARRQGSGESVSASNPAIRLTREDREAVRRWRRFMLPAVFIVVLTLLAAERAYQTLRPTASATSVADEAQRAPPDVEISQAGGAR